MEQFSLEKYIENPSRKVVTRDGRPVRIVCWDAPTKNPIYGFVEGDDGITCWQKDGRFSNLIDNVDIFFADEEEELTEFEKAIYQYTCTTVTACNGEVYDDKELKPIVKGIAKELLDLARQEVEKKYRIVDKDNSDWEDAYEQGKQDTLKDLPKWKKATEYKELDRHVAIIDYNNKVALTDVLDADDYYIELEDLLKLPKEE